MDQQKIEFSLDDRQRIYNQLVKRLAYVTDNFIDQLLENVSSGAGIQLSNPLLGDMLNAFVHTHLEKQILGPTQRDLRLDPFGQKLVPEQQPIILVVDDEEVSRQLTVWTLRRGRYRVEEAENAAVGYLKVGLHRPSLVLVDHEMPKVSGLEFIFQVKNQQEYQSLPLIMLTSHREKKLVEAAIQAGVSDFIVKPFQQEELLEKVAAKLPPTE
jgi:CheY-like chemotaxis protein